MSAIIGSIIGFFGAIVPDIFKTIRERGDRKHEIAIMQLQMKAQTMGHSQRLDEIGANADIAETKAIYKTYKAGIRWVDALNATVRPVLAYCFFGLYAYVKYMLFVSGGTIWDMEDQVIFSGIISFYFGQRAMNKVRGI